ncbi:hypothetical protein QOZ80_6BG0498780 [Eleusine coracana subsp. coracana]|nr:hypothetical protein QOZ80_6BG0498780 [Eleusine coracana subsp. coracana]
MAPHSSLFRGLVVAVLVASAYASPPTQDEADKFLRACCANTSNAAVCYNSLHPLAGSFEGNLVKVSSAATVIAYARLRIFDAELRTLLRRGTGAGESVDRALKSCMMAFELWLAEEDGVLAKLRRLETAAGRKEKQAKSNLQYVNLAVADVESATGDTCMDDFINSADGVLASPVGKKMLAGNATVHLYGGIALELVASIKL